MNLIGQSSRAAMLLIAATWLMPPAWASDEGRMPADEAAHALHAAPMAPAAISAPAIITEPSSLVAAEPESWAMMIGGFLLAGLVLRRSRSVASFV